MMDETAVNLPLSVSEINEIMVEKFRLHLSRNSYLSGTLAYNGFELDLTAKIKLYGTQQQPVETLVWDRTREGRQTGQFQETTVQENYASDASPNVERMKHDMPLTVETTDNRGQKSFKKIRAKK